MNKENILLKRKHLLQKPLLLDGAMGSLLQMQGFKIDEHLWASRLNIDMPDAVIKIHKQYVDAGADIITTNTFRTNPVAKKKSNLQMTNSELVKISVDLAKKAAENDEIFIAGSNAPAEDCYQKERTISKFDLEYNHKKHIELLWQSGVDIIWNETQSHLDEIEIICKFCNEAGVPFVINLFLTSEMKLLSNEPFEEVIEIIKSYHPDAIGVNCISPITFRQICTDNFAGQLDGFYLNCGKENFIEDRITCGVSPEEYTVIVAGYLSQQLTFIGSCCGSSPLHTSLLRKKIDEVYRN